MVQTQKAIWLYKGTMTSLHKIFLSCLIGVFFSTGSMAETIPSIVVSIRTLDNEYYHAIVKGAEMYAKSLGASDKLIILLSEGNSEKQVNDFHRVLKQTNRQAIFYFDPNESPVVNQLAEIARDAGVYFATEWNKPDDIWPWDYNPYWVVHTTPNGRESGYETAKALFQAMQGQGKILALQGRMGNSIAVARYEGLQQALKEFPNIELVDVQQANWSRMEAMEFTQTWLTQYSDIQGIWAANDEMALGALEILREIGKAGKVKVTGIDATGDAVAAVLAHEMLCTLSPDPYWQVGMSLSFVYQAYQGKIHPTEWPHEKRAFHIKSLLITQDNAQSFLDDYVNGSPQYDYNALWKDKWSGPIQ